MKKNLLLISLLFISQLAYAQEEVPVITQKPDSNIMTTDSGEYFRSNKRFNIAANAGFGPNTLFTGGYSAGYFLDSNSLIVLDYLSSRSEQSTKVSVFALERSSTEKTERSDIGLSYKRFFGNSFFIRGGLGYRKVDSEYSRYSIYSGQTSAEIEGESTYAVFAIGNERQWENFTLGCEWIGTTLPINYRITKDTAKEDSEFNDSFFGSSLKSTLKDSGLILLHVTAGASF